MAMEPRQIGIMEDPSREPGSAPFDEVAARYDADFTDTPLGRRQRAIVHAYLSGLIRPGMRVLELNCGTGHDALWLARQGATVIATDASGEMAGIVREKAARSQHGALVTARRMRIEEIVDPETRAALGRFDLILSNFDGLNCVPNPAALAAPLADLLHPGGSLLLVYMNPVCAMEILSNLLRLRPRRAFQRLRREGIDVHIGNGISMRTWFHPVGEVVRAMAPRFAPRHVEAVGLITPPTSMRSFYHRHQRLFGIFVPLEDRLAPVPPFNRIGDHVLLHLQHQD